MPDIVFPRDASSLLPQTSVQSSVQSSHAILMFTTTYCGDCRRAKRIFLAQGVPFAEINIEEDRTAAAYLEAINDGMQSVPTILFPDRSILVEPGNAVLEAKLRSFSAAARP